MSSDAKRPGNGPSGAGGGGGFRAKLDHYLYSGEKKHVFAGMAIIGVLFGIPWYLMNQGEFHFRIPWYLIVLSCFIGSPVLSLYFGSLMDGIFSKSQKISP